MEGISPLKTILHEVGVLASPTAASWSSMSRQNSHNHRHNRQPQQQLQVVDNDDDHSDNDKIDEHDGQSHRTVGSFLDQKFLFLPNTTSPIVNGDVQDTLFGQYHDTKPLSIENHHRTPPKRMANLSLFQQY
jgi:hypothetical protein